MHAREPIGVVGAATLAPGQKEILSSCFSLRRKRDDLPVAGYRSDLPILFRIFFPNTVISVVLEQHVRRRVSHLKRRHVRVLKTGNVVTAE